jgi:hypothetical protein
VPVDLRRAPLVLGQGDPSGRRHGVQEFIAKDLRKSLADIGGEAPYNEPGTAELRDNTVSVAPTLVYRPTTPSTAAKPRAGQTYALPLIVRQGC